MNVQNIRHQSDYSYFKSEERKNIDVEENVKKNINVKEQVDYNKYSQKENIDVVKLASESDSITGSIIKNELMNTSTVNKISAKATNDKILSVQIRLKALGFYEGSAASGVYDNYTEKALKNFQKVYGGSYKPSSSNLYLFESKINDAYTEYNKVYKSAKTELTLKKLGFTGDLSSAKKNFAQIWTFLKIGMGVTNQVVAGVLGNIKQESGFCPTNAQDRVYPGIDNSKEYNGSNYRTDDKIGYGIVQWTYSTRKKGLMDMAKEMGEGKNVGNMNVQLAFMRKELLGDYSAMWKNGVIGQGRNNERIAAGIIYQSYEGAGDNTLKVRQDNATLIYNTMNGV